MAHPNHARRQFAGRFQTAAGAHPADGFPSTLHEEKIMQQDPGKPVSGWKPKSDPSVVCNIAQFEQDCRDDHDRLKGEIHEVSKNLPQIKSNLQYAQRAVSGASGDAYDWASPVHEGLDEVQRAQQLVNQANAIWAQGRERLGTLHALSGAAREAALDQITEQIVEAEELVQQAADLKASAKSTNTNIPEQFREP
jgi:hypothetical protein